MAHQIYALLVGIDTYPDQISNLKGCVNDINALSAYLDSRIADKNHQIHTKILLNQQATRAAIISGFQNHLGQAMPGDIVLFAFSGHGSQEPAPQEYWHLEPDGLNETLVCWDSRLDGCKDLSDKELAQLIADVAQQGAQLTIILDCCHSGSGTRNLGRFLPSDTRHHPFDSYLLSEKIVQQLTRSQELNITSRLKTVPDGNHILLAACRDMEVAREISVGGQKRGAFSYYLLKTLQQANRALSYRELYQRLYASVKGLQSPQLEVTNANDVDKLFLHKTAISSLPYFTLTYDRAHSGWMINGGAMHGIPPAMGNETTRLALYAFDSSPEDLGQRANAMGKAEVIDVLPQLSRVKLLALTGIQELRSDLAFKAIITDLPLSPMGIQLSGEEAGLGSIRKLLLLGSDDGNAYVREATAADNARLRVIACDLTYQLTPTNSDRPLTQPIEGYTNASAQQVLQYLEHIARWQRVLELTNPAVEQIPSDAIKVQIFQGEQELQDIPMRLEYEHQGGRWHQPQIRVKLTNQSEQSLYCALLGLAENYEIAAGWFEASGIWLQPGEAAWALSGKPIYLRVPKSLWQQGIIEFRDTLKLIVSTAEFDARLLEQGALGTPPVSARRMDNVGRSTRALNRLLGNVGRRTLSSPPENEEYDDWLTRQWEFVTIRPRPA